MTADSLFPGIGYDPARDRQQRERDADVARRRKDRTDARDVLVELPVDRELRSKLEADMLTWMRYLFPLIYNKPFSDDQAEWGRQILRVQRDGGKQAIGAPRGQGKSAFIKGALLFGIVTGLIRYAIIVCKNQRIANKRLRELKKMMLTPAFGALYPEVYTFAKALEGSAQRAGKMLYNGTETDFSWKENSLTLPWLEGLDWVKCHGATIEAAGIETPIRGTTEATRGGELLRPDYVLIDDPQDKAAARSPGEVAKILEYIDSDVGGLVAPGGKMAQVALVTIIQENDAAAQLLNRSLRPAWHGIKNKLIYELPKNEKLLAQYEQLVFDCAVEGLIDDDGLCEATIEWWREHQTEIEQGAKVCNDNLHLPPPGQTPKALSAVHWAISKRASMARGAFEAEYQNNPTTSSATTALAISPLIVQQRVTKAEKGLIPGGFDVLTVGVDVSSKELHFVAVAWNRDLDQGHIVDYGTVAVNAPVGAGDVRDRESPAYKLLANALPNAFLRLQLRPDAALDGRGNAPYRRHDGTAKNPDVVCVDAGYMRDTVRKFCESRRPRTWLMSKGVESSRVPKSITEQLWIAPDSDYWVRTVVVDDGRQGTTKRHLLYHNVDLHKHWAQQGWLVPMDHAGALSLFGSYGTEHLAFAEQICSESMIERERGEIIWQLNNKNNPNNHWLDALALAINGYRVARDFLSGFAAPGAAELPTPDPLQDDAPEASNPQGVPATPDPDPAPAADSEPDTPAVSSPNGVQATPSATAPAAPASAPAIMPMPSPVEYGRVEYFDD